MSSIHFCHAFKVQVSDTSNINSNSIKFTQPVVYTGLAEGRFSRA